MFIYEFVLHLPALLFYSNFLLYSDTLYNFALYGITLQWCSLLIVLYCVLYHISDVARHILHRTTRSHVECDVTYHGVLWCTLY